MKSDDLPEGRHPPRHATPGSLKPSEAIEPELSGDQRIVEGSGPGEYLQIIQDGDSDRADLQKTAPFSESGMPEPEFAADLEGRFLGRFHLEKEIARGGMGIILEARDIDVDRKVAIKLLLREHQKKYHIHQQFINEARITGRLQHPGIVPIYETGKTLDDRPFFAMKLVNGMTLANLFAARSSPQEDLPRFLNIFEHVCQTLSYTHACGIIHLDIKPANVMVGAFGEVHLMDWGLARASTNLCVSQKIQDGVEPLLPKYEPAEKLCGISSQDLTVDVPAGALWGTPAYMSPEQARGQCADVRADVFGLGGILCEILTGCAPYGGANFLDVCFKAARADLSDTYSKLTDCGADGVLVRLAMKCLSADADERPADASIVACELTLYLESLLRRAASDLERFFELSLDLFCIAGLDGIFRRVNANFSRVLGYSEKELLSRPFMEFVHPEDREQTIDVMSQLQLGHPVVEFQNRYSVADGTWRCFEWTAKSVPQDRIIFAVARDVTNRMRSCPLE